MSGTSLSGRLARCIVALAGAVALAGCATGYAYVQPDVADSGGYYTSDNAYTGQGYYDWYGTGPYYPGTSGWGYYNGTNPYAGAFGWYGDDGYYGYGSPFVFNLGISNVWGFPGYWGPWYSLDFPIWGCWNGCWHHRHHDHWRHDHWHGHADPDRHDSVIAHLTPPRGLRPEHASVPSRWQRGPVHSLAHFAERRPVLPSATFAPHAFVRAPIRRAIMAPRFDAGPTRPAFRPAMPEVANFGRRSFAAPALMPHAHPAPQPAFRAMPAAPPPSRNSSKSATRIP